MQIQILDQIQQHYIGLYIWAALCGNSILFINLTACTPEQYMYYVAQIITIDLPRPIAIGSSNFKAKPIQIIPLILTYLDVLIITMLNIHVAPAVFCSVMQFMQFMQSACIQLHSVAMTTSIQFSSVYLLMTSQLNML